MLEKRKVWKLRCCSPEKFGFVGAYTVNSHCWEDGTVRRRLVDPQSGFALG